MPSSKPDTSLGEANLLNLMLSSKCCQRSQIAFLKMHASRTAQLTAADAVQIFGGRGLTQTGMGRFVEHHSRTHFIDTVGGGAEDVLGDLGVRQALRSMPKAARL
ncbi:hypothetical protein C8J57DRAFT_703719 [Mycena rebaudengoi]|nr:hypothetical protein C8J57DRAFT_703719 [Mycena rebaudengoi]